MEQRDDLAMPFLLIGSFTALVDVVHEQLAREGFAGVRAHHGFALQAIGSGCTSVQLGERLRVSKQAATKTAKSLQEMGLVERRTNDRDRRERTLVITARGRRLLELSALAFQREVANWRQLAGDENVDATTLTLKAVTGGRWRPDLSQWA